MATAGTITMICDSCRKKVTAQIRIDMRPPVSGASSAIADVTAVGEHECAPDPGWRFWSRRRPREAVVRRQRPSLPELGPMPIEGPPGPSGVSPPPPHHCHAHHGGGGR